MTVQRIENDCLLFVCVFFYERLLSVGITPPGPLANLRQTIQVATKRLIRRSLAGSPRSARGLILPRETQGASDGGGGMFFFYSHTHAHTTGSGPLALAHLLIVAGPPSGPPQQWNQRGGTDTSSFMWQGPGEGMLMGYRWD